MKGVRTNAQAFSLSIDTLRFVCSPYLGTVPHCRSDRSHSHLSRVVWRTAHGFDTASPANHRRCDNLFALGTFGAPHFQCGMQRSCGIGRPHGRIPLVVPSHCPDRFVAWKGWKSRKAISTPCLCFLPLRHSVVLCLRNTSILPLDAHETTLRPACLRASLSPL